MHDSTLHLLGSPKLCLNYKPWWVHYETSVHHPHLIRINVTLVSQFLLHKDINFKPNLTSQNRFKPYIDLYTVYFYLYTINLSLSLIQQVYDMWWMLWSSKQNTHVHGFGAKAYCFYLYKYIVSYLCLSKKNQNCEHHSHWYKQNHIIVLVKLFIYSLQGWIHRHMVLQLRT